MKRERKFKRGDRVTWSSEAGVVSGIVIKKVTRPYNYHGWIHRASNDDPQYLIKSDKTDHIAIHRPSALHLVPKRKPTRRAKRAGLKNRVTSL